MRILFALLLVYISLQQLAFSREGGNSALFWAAMAEDTNALQYYISQGLNLDAKNSIGWTPVMMAADKCKLKSVQILLEAGADPTITVNGIQLKNINACDEVHDYLRSKFGE